MRIEERLDEQNVYFYSVLNLSRDRIIRLTAFGLLSALAILVFKDGISSEQEVAIYFDLEDAEADAFEDTIGFKLLFSGLISLFLSRTFLAREHTTAFVLPFVEWIDASSPPKYILFNQVKIPDSTC